MNKYYKKRPLKQYALYKGDKFLGVGTIKELAKEMETTEQAIRYYHTPAYKKRNYKNCRILINIEE